MYLCDTFARKIYLQKDLTVPPTSFDSCGWNLYDITENAVAGIAPAAQYSSGNGLSYNNATMFFNDPMILGGGSLFTPNNTMLSGNFTVFNASTGKTTYPPYYFNLSVQIVNAEEAARLGVMCYNSYDKAGLSGVINAAAIYVSAFAVWVTMF